MFLPVAFNLQEWLDTLNAHPSSRVITTSERNRSKVETQQMARLTRIWNHCCSCKDDRCATPNCTKIKPAVLHQRKLKSQETSCTIRGCEYCALFFKLKQFSNPKRNNSGRRKPRTKGHGRERHWPQGGEDELKSTVLNRRFDEMAIDKCL